MSTFQNVLNKFSNTPIRVTVTPKGMHFAWCYKGKGFGSIFISIIDGKVYEEGCYPAGRLMIDSECETKEFVKKVVCQAIDEGLLK